MSSNLNWSLLSRTHIQEGKTHPKYHVTMPSHMWEEPGEMENSENMQQADLPNKSLEGFAGKETGARI